MENISLEQIDLIMQRANVSYSEAKEALEKCNGDALEALILLEKEEKTNTTSSSSKSASCQTFKESVKSFVHKLNITRFILKKDERTCIDIPLSIALLGIIFCFYISIFALIVAYFCGYRISIVGQNDVADKLNQGLDFIKH